MKDELIMKVLRYITLGLALVAIVFIVNYLGEVLLPFAIAWLLAYLIYPIVAFIQHQLKVKVRVVAVVMALLIVIAAIALVGWLIIPPMFEQMGRLGDALDRWIADNTHSNSLTQYIHEWLYANRYKIEEVYNEFDITATMRSIMPKVFNLVGQTASIVVSVVASFITILYTFFILLDYEYLTENWVRVFPPKYRDFWQELMGEVKNVLNRYIRGQAMVALVMGLLFCIGFTIIDFPMAIGLGILIGILDMVPYLHTFALIPAAFLSMIKAAETGQNFWTIFLAAVAIFAIVQIIIEAFVIPKIMGKAMNMNPAILLLSLSVWGALLGFVGLIVALPLTTIIIAYWKRYVTKE